MQNSRSGKNRSKFSESSQPNRKRVLPSAGVEVPEVGTASLSFPVVAIGASAGGLEALTQLVENLTPDTNMAFVVVQHLDPSHKSMLVDILSRRASLPIQEVKRRTEVEPNHIYVIPPNRNMFLEKGALCLFPREASRAQTMPIDYLFRTLAVDQVGNCVGVILSGSGSDGSLGIEEVKAAGGITFVQDPETAKFDGMPRFAISTGCVDYVLTPEAIALELRRIANHPFTSGHRISELSQENLLHRIYGYLLNRTSVDFKHYKQNTIKRRIFRRMALAQIDSLEEYVKKLNQDQNELDSLYQDLLIKVTCFFREPESFAELQSHIFPDFIRNRTGKESIRIWVPACSTGEEVYSLAIALLESAGDRSGSLPIQIFGTDVSEDALAKARAGTYIENIALDVSPERLRRWFNKVDSGYQISKHIRDMCVFARHNVVIDPPFSKMDLISCRNLLIYFDMLFQAKVMPVFHYALKPGGLLMLGGSESVGDHFDLFSTVDKKTKLYRSKINLLSRHFSFQKQPAQGSAAPASLAQVPKMSSAQQEADKFVVSRFAPAGVIVDEDFKIIQFRGSTGDYLEPSPGRATFNLIKMARGNLGLELRPLFHRARTTKKAVRSEKFRFQPKQGDGRDIALEIVPLKSEAISGTNFLVLFEELRANDETSPVPAIVENSADRIEYDVLQKKLADSQSFLQSTIEDFEASNEELKSASEEIRSSNEELQSTNEELETAKEELQSTNEELVTVNEEVRTRNKELSQLNSDLTNFLSSVNIPIIMLGTDLKIRRFTPLIQRVFNLISTDVGRSFSDITPKIEVPDLDKSIRKVVETAAIHEEQVTDSEGHVYTMYIRPYKTRDGHIDGVVLVFQDIDTIHRAMLDLNAARAYSEGIVEAVADPLMVLDENLVIQGANSAFYTFFKTTAKLMEHRSIFDVDAKQWRNKEFRSVLERFVRGKNNAQPLEITSSFSQIGEKTLKVQLRRIQRQERGSTLVLMGLSDLTERKSAEKERARLHYELGREKSLFEAILHQAHIGVGIFEAASGKLLLANRYLSSVLKRKISAGATLETFAKMSATHGNGLPLKAGDWPMVQALQKKKVIDDRQIILGTGKKSKTLLVGSSPVFDSNGKILAVVALFHDYTAEVEIQKRIVEVSSREQRRIAQELHDGLGQRMAAVAYRVNALKLKLAGKNIMESRDAAEIGKLIEGTLAGTRDLAKFVLPVDVNPRGLMLSLKELAAASERLYKINCLFRCTKPVAVSNPKISTEVYRIAQEAIHNAVRHGRPRQIVISLEKKKGLIELGISNDGKDFSESNKGKGMGIQIMEYRSKLIEGELSVKKRSPKGTVVSCLFRILK